MPCRSFRQVLYSDYIHKMTLLRMLLTISCVGDGCQMQYRIWSDSLDVLFYIFGCCDVELAV